MHMFNIPNVLLKNNRNTSKIEFVRSTSLFSHQFIIL